MFSRIKHTLNFDGSHNNQNNKASAGCIIRDNQGDLVVAASYNLTNEDFPCYNVAIAEAMGLKKGLLLAKQNSLTLNYVKGDNKEVIDLVLGRTFSRPGPTLSVIISEIRGMLDTRVVVVELITRENNKVADKLAYIGSSLLTSSKVFYRYAAFDLPSQVAELITQEKASSRSIAGHEEEGSSSGGSGLGMIGGAIAVGAALFGLYSAFSSNESSSSSSTRNIKHDSFPSSIGYVPTYPKRIPDFYTLQYFGSDRNQLEKARAGCMITNNGSFVVASAHNLDHQYPDCHIAIAEAIALKMGLKLAKDNDIRLSLIQGRNEEVRDRVLGRERRQPRLPQLSVIIALIKSTLREQRIDPEDDETLQLVGEHEIIAARELAIIGGTLVGEIEIYPRDRGLPDKVARALATY